MSKKPSFRVVFETNDRKPVFKGDLLDEKYNSFDKVKENILEKSKDKKFDKDRSALKDKFVLKIKGFDVPNLESIWNEDTFNFFLARYKENPQAIELIISKVNKFPKWEPPKYGKLFKKILEEAWEPTEKEILNELEPKLDNGKKKFIQEKMENDENLKEEMFDELHVNVICNNCLSSNFSGSRYICSECNNYNLCEDCKDHAVINHNPEHTFILLNYQVLVDIQKYNSIFAPNKLLIKNKYEPFEIKVQIVNNGNTSLQGCFISQIRFGKKYLGCLKTTITTKCDTGDKVELDLLLKFEDDDEEEIEVLDSYEGYFRLMTEEGIPFGDILHIKLLIERE